MKWNAGVLIAFGFVVGIPFGSFAFASVHSLLLGSDGRLQWEILVTGAVAICAAFYAARPVWAQLRQADRLDETRRQRRERAARAVLPLALDELIDYGEACISGLYSLRGFFAKDGSLDRSQGGAVAAAWTPPHLPDTVLTVFKECIEFFDEKPALALAELVQRLQVQNSRLSSHMARIRLNDGVRLVVRANIQGTIIDTADLLARAGYLFSYARGSKVDDFTVKRDRVETNLRVVGCFTDDEIKVLADTWERANSSRAELKSKADGDSSE